MATSVQSTQDDPLNDDSDLDLTLPECYDLVFKLHLDLETTDESTSSDHNQARLREGILFAEKAIRMVNELQLFSRNEEIDEVSTNEIKYMMLSAYLGYFIGLNTHIPRVLAVQKSKLCYTDFLRLQKSYGMIEFNISLIKPEEEDGNSEHTVTPTQLRRQDLNAMAAHRNSKIQRFREKKDMEKRLSELKVLVEKEHVDDELKREFYLTQLKRWANVAIDEIDNCNLELEMLKHREEMTRGGIHYQESLPQKSKLLRPFILTKSVLQKQVFGAGYPAIATMTVDEFYEEKVREGTLSESVHGHGGHSLQEWAKNPEKDALDREREDSEKESKIEKDDLETLERARAMDEWKDDHRRGDGNRHNKG